MNPLKDISVDLHMHTLDSDGSIELYDLFEEILMKGINLFSITEHETMVNNSKIKSFARKNNLMYIPGVELTVNDNGRRHILGYGVDCQNEKLLKVMKNNQAVVSSGRDDEPHLFITPEEAIEAILDAGGVPILAHPGCPIYGPDFKSYVSKMLSYGVRGIECFHPENNDEITKFCIELCIELDLYITGGSDYHGNCNPLRKLDMMKLQLDDLKLKDLITMND